MLVRFWNSLKGLLVHHSSSLELGRWNSHITQKHWKYYLDMANYDNCCCSKDFSQNGSKKKNPYKNP